MHPQSIIYLLEDPRDGLIRYVGCSTRSRVIRLAEHILAAAAGSHRPVCGWIRDLMADDCMPSIFVIDRVPASVAGAAEAYWIGYYRQNDALLLNVTTRVANEHHYVRYLNERPRPGRRKVRARRRPQQVPELLVGSGADVALPVAPPPDRATAPIYLLLTPHQPTPDRLSCGTAHA